MAIKFRVVLSYERDINGSGNGGDGFFDAVPWEQRSRTAFFETSADALAAGTLLNYQESGGEKYATVEIKEVIVFTNGEELILEPGGDVFHTPQDDFQIHRAIVHADQDGNISLELVCGKTAEDWDKGEFFANINDGIVSGK